MPAEVRQVMAAYWKEHSKQGSVEEMMLDNTAEELSKEELPEILSYLPEYAGKDVIELGAGIGRFTTEIAKKAKSVAAVDFMEEFINKNKKTNQNFNNIEYVVADVTKLDRPKESADLIFSNWLLMYLNDNEVQEFFRKQLSWLRPGGYLFIRESCRHQSGNKDRGANPTEYRDPELYEAFYSSTTMPCDENNFYGFDLVVSKSVDTYIKRKNNSNQVIWLIEKVKRDNSQNHGFKSFQEFLDNQQYSARGILLYEKIFGRTYVSTGGPETTEEFVELLNLQRGQQVLDVGGGIGGSAFYMAKKFGVKVVSIDLSSNMTQIGLQRAEEVGCGPDQVVFEIADATKRDYPAQSFDVIYSRDTILHIPDKLALFKKFYKFLRPGGKVLISDYCCSPDEHSEKFKTYVKQRGYNLLSPAQYGKVLEAAGFVNVRAEDRSAQFAKVLKSEIAKTESIKDEFIKEFDEDGYRYIVDGWKEKLGRVEIGDQRWGLFYAEKS
ncbi:phosphoethanolamine N-methyltransferase 3 isoform X2 [Aplysia californica]|uniref:phosphoethanolamine N-methyltransferase n=1 Tax=Aplysia californica TaxID=6500 RepID=A0ABM0JL85_APLCA|nr:phosphoethanolamine N-methyltransferase 3 isoform X2 [Aplysia californica]